METLRVLQVIGSMNRGGAENMLMNLYRNIDREKIQFDFVEHSLTQSAFDEEILSYGGKIYRCPRYTGKNFSSYVNWWNDFFRQHGEEYAVIHGHIGSTAAIYLGVAKKNGLFTIAHSHNTRVKNTPRELLYAVFSYPTRFIADYFFACGHDAAVSRFGRRIGENAQRCNVLHNAIDLERFTYNESRRKEMREQLHIGEEPVIGHVGRFGEQKNHLFLIEIFHEILSLRPEAKLLLVGDGELRGKIEERVREYGMEKQVIFAGVQIDVSGYYQTMDVLVFPSLYEGLPLTIVEAQATGMPCVISNHVPPECRLTDDLVSVEELSSSARKWAEHVLLRLNRTREGRSAQLKEKGYDIHQTAKWLEEFYQGVWTNA